jgi:hypothetical protein
MYVRQAKQFMRAVDPTFDERKFGFGSLQDLLRACQREGLFRIERDRQGVIRLFPGNIMLPVAGEPEPEEPTERRDPVEVRAERYSNQADRQGWSSRHEPAAARQDAAAEPMDEAEAEAEAASGRPGAQQDRPEPEVVEGAVVQEIDVRPVIDGVEAPIAAGGGSPEEAPKRGRGTRKRAGAPARARKSEGAKAEGATRARKTTARPRSSSRARARKGADE